MLTQEHEEKAAALLATLDVARTTLRLRKHTLQYESQVSGLQRLQ
jgi:hypothetical protein